MMTRLLTHEEKVLLTRIAVLDVLIEMKGSGQDTPGWDDLPESVKRRVTDRYKSLVAEHVTSRN